MAQVPYAPIEDGQEATNQLFNSRFLALHNAINGGLDAANLADNAITTPKLADGSVTTSKIPNAAITTAKFNPGTIDFLKPLTSNFNSTNTSYQDVPQGSITYTAGPTNEKLFLFFTAMLIAEGGGAAHATLSLNGVDQPENLYVEAASRWQIQTRTYTMDVNANQTVTIKMRHRAGNASFNTIFHADNALWRASIRGFSVWRTG